MPYILMNFLDKYFLLSVFFIIVLGLILYIFSSIGMQTIAKREGVERDWFAWIPYLDSFLLGKIVSFKFGVHSAWLILVVDILNYVASRYNNLFTDILGYVYTLFMTVVYYWLFRKYSTKAILMTIFSLLTLHLITPFLIFAIRNNGQQIKAE